MWENPECSKKGWKSEQEGNKWDGKLYNFIVRAKREAEERLHIRKKW